MRLIWLLTRVALAWVCAGLIFWAFDQWPAPWQVWQAAGRLSGPYRFVIQAMLAASALWIGLFLVLCLIEFVAGYWRRLARRQD